MSKLFKSALFISLLCLSSLALAKEGLTGYWMTFNDDTGTPRSIVQLSDAQGEVLGDIVKVYYKQGEGPGDVCEKCSGSRHNQRFLGMNILWGMKARGDEWAGGYVLDPEVGKVYHGKLVLLDNGAELKVRGYIGFPLFGRTEIWKRVPQSILEQTGTPDISLS